MFLGESHPDVQTLTFAELRIKVAICASTMRHVGVLKGDRVVGYMPNCMEAVIYMLAATSLGAIWSSTAPDFGSIGVLERFQQIQPKLLISVNAVRYNGKLHDHMSKLAAVVEGEFEIL